MFGMNKSGANAYSHVGLETSVVEASPLKLTIMLYEGAITACIKAQQAIAQNDIQKKCELLNHAVSIIESGLRASLDKQVGGDIGGNLDALYQYMTISLMRANLNKDANKVAEIQHLLMDLKIAWETLEKTVPVPSARSQASVQQLMQHQAQQQLQESGAQPRLAIHGV